MEVIVTGKLTTFGQRSKYQIIVESIELAGKGALLALIEARKKALAAEGLFDPAHKKKLPFLPAVLGGPAAWDADGVISRAIDIRDGAVCNPDILAFQHRAPKPAWRWRGGGRFAHDRQCLLQVPGGFGVFLAHQADEGHDTPAGGGIDKSLRDLLCKDVPAAGRRGEGFARYHTPFDHHRQRWRRQDTPGD